MPTDALHFPDGEHLCDYIAQQTNGVTLLSFSCGKDSLGMWLQLRRHFTRIVPFFLYIVPDLQFVEDTLKYYEDFFGTHIYRLPHPALYKYLNQAIYQPPERISKIVEAKLVEYGADDVADIVKLKEGIPFRSCYTGMGVRAVDSLNRWAAIKTYGPVNQKRYNFYPIYDWRKERLVNEIEAAGVKLSVEYRVFGRTFDGLDWRFMKPMKEAFPADYARVKEWFPLVEMEILRHEWREQLFD